MVGGANMGVNSCVIKTDSQGNKKWQTYFGSYLSQFSMNKAENVEPTSDGDCIISGWGSNMGYLVKMSSTDTTQVRFFKFYTDASSVCSAYPTTDGYILAGSTITLGNGQSNIYVIKTNSTGDIIKQSTFGTSDGGGAEHMKLTSDGGCIIIGTNNWVVKTDDNCEVH